MVLLCKQLGTRKLAIDPIIKDGNLIENIILYCGEGGYGEPSIKDILFALVPFSVTVFC